MSTEHRAAVTGVARRHSPTLMVVVIAYLVFIFLGIPDGMLGIAWPSMRGDFGLALGQMGVLLTASTAGFLITSFSAGRLITVLGVSRLLIITTILRGLALIGMGLAPSWPALVAAFLVFGLASGGIDGGLNTYFAMNFSPRLMNWLHASFGLGATLGPILMTVLLSMEVAWRWGYIVVGLLQAALALLIFIRADAWELRSATHRDGAARKLEKISYRATLRRPIVWVNILIFFLYSGTEITAGNWMYTIFTESRGCGGDHCGLLGQHLLGQFHRGSHRLRLCRQPLQACQRHARHDRRGRAGGHAHLVEPRRPSLFSGAGLDGLCNVADLSAAHVHHALPLGRGRCDQCHRLSGGGRVDWHRSAAGAGGRAGRTRQPGGDPALHPRCDDPDVRAA
jgi:hypothetical protein